jgi:hypothetical protein
MMIRLILDQGADECLQEAMKLSGLATAGEVFSDALGTYLALMRATDEMMRIAQWIEKLHAPLVGVTEALYESEP